MGELGAVNPTIGLKPDRYEDLYPRTRSYRYSKDQSSKTFAACKTQGLTVGEAMFTAMITVMAKLNGSRTRGKFARFLPVDYRELNELPFNNAARYLDLEGIT
jgi:hypothetical protein